jgi:NAD(P)-dependent dehydrogenase (short-subunit alcohol dehydrogenase family)
MKTEGNVIFITGGGSGIGRGLAEALHHLGNKVIISGRRKGHLAKTLEANPGMDSIELDLTDPESIRRAAEELISKYPTLNVLINNAGIMLIDDASALVDDELVPSTIATNLMGPIRITGALIAHLKKQESAAVLIVSSVLGFTPMAMTAVLFVYQGRASLLCSVPPIQVTAYSSSGTRSHSSLGPHGAAQQQRRASRDASRRVSEGHDGGPCNRGGRDHGSAREVPARPSRPQRGSLCFTLQ